MSQHASPTILIADDAPFMRLLIERSLDELADEGVTILTSADGQVALEMIEQHRPQLVVLDAMMPRMNGFDVCRRVKRELSLEEVFVIMLTAKGQELDRQRGQEVGANVFMTKPFDPDELLARARAVIEGRDQPAE